MGCGLGYVSARLHAELSPHVDGLNVAGIDVSSTATAQASSLHPHLTFAAVDILKDDLQYWERKFDMLYIKDILWYVCSDADKFIRRAKMLLKEGGGYTCCSPFRINENISGPIFPPPRSPLQSFFRIILKEFTHHRPTKSTQTGS